MVAPQPFFTPRGTPFSVYYRCLVQSELGVEIDLLTYGQGQDVEIPGVTIHRIPAFKLLGPIPVGPSLLKAFLDVFMVLRVILMLLRKRYDFVHAHEEAVFFMRFLKPIFRFKLVYDMHSSLPQQLTNFGFTRSRIVRWIFQKLEDSCLRGSDAVITISPALEEYALSRMRDSRRHFLIENSIFEDVHVKNGDDDGQRSDDTARTTHADPLAGIPNGDPRIVYAGTFERYQGIDLLLRAHADVLAERPDAFLVLAGGHPSHVERYKAMAEELGVSGRCVFTGMLSPRAAKDLVRQATLLVSARTYGNNTPMKIYHYLASGKPFVATDIESHSQILDERSCFLVPPDAQAFARGILSALEDPARAHGLSEHARSVYAQRYSKEAFSRKMQDMLELLGSG
jgi:glycosyltransferase involved in cell wall biosynthesis